MGNLKINHGAVWVNVILLTALGFTWYGPLFGESWMAMVGLNPAEVEANPPGAGIWITNLVATILPMYVLSWLFVKLKVEDALTGAKYGFIIVFSFVFMTQMTGNMFAQRIYELTWIEGGYNLIAITLAGIILGAWRSYENSDQS